MKLSHWHRQLNRYHLILFLILVVGACLRFYSINYDLPFLYDNDEPIVVTLALRMLKNRDLNPHWFAHPATPQLYLLAGIYAVIFVVGWVAGVFKGAADFRQLYYNDPTVFFFSGRVLSAFFDLGTIWLVYKIGRRLGGPVAGLIAAAVVALSPLHIWLSEQVLVNSQLTFLIVLAFWFCLNIVEKQNWKSYLLAGFVTGVAVVSKYPAAVFTLTIAVAHFVKNPVFRPTAHKKLLGSAAATIAGIVAGSPFFFFELRRVIAELVVETRPEHLTATGEGLFRNILWYLKGPLPESLSVAGLLLAGVGIVLALTSKQKTRWVLASFPLFFLIFISSLTLRWERWILPAVPFLALLLSLAVVEVSRMIADRFNRTLAVGTTVLLLLVVIVPLLSDAVAQARGVGTPNTTTTARQWIIDNLPAGSRVLVEVVGPQLPTEKFKVFVVEQDGSVAMSKEINAGNFQPGWDIGRIKNIEDVHAHGIEYFVMTSFYQHYVDERSKYPVQAATYEKLMSNSTLLYDISGIRRLRRGHRIRVFKLPSNSPGSSEGPSLGPPQRQAHESS